MIANDILIDAFTRVHESLHRVLGDITPEELVKEPHPSIGWLAWRISRVRTAMSRGFRAASSCGSAKDGLPGSVCRPNQRIMGDRRDTRANKSTLSALARSNSSTTTTGIKLVFQRLERSVSG